VIAFRDKGGDGVSRRVLIQAEGEFLPGGRWGGNRCPYVDRGGGAHSSWAKKNGTVRFTREKIEQRMKTLTLVVVRGADAELVKLTFYIAKRGAKGRV